MSDPSTGHQPEQPTRPIGPSEEPPPVVEEAQGMPLGTFVFGLMVMAVGLLILVSVLYNITLSGSTVAIILFLGAGLVLIVGGLVAARRSSRTNPSRS